MSGFFVVILRPRLDNLGVPVGFPKALASAKYAFMFVYSFYAQLIDIATVFSVKNCKASSAMKPE
jgi:hypothetical protein